MQTYSFPHLADATVLREFDAAISHACTAIATLLAYLAEVDDRQLYREAAYPSMLLYCMREKRMSKHTALKRIRVARTAREFPALFPALADGRLNQTAVLLLGPHLTPETADELLAAATHKSKVEIELLLAARFPKPDVPTELRPLGPAGVTGELAAADAPALQVAPELLDPSSAPDVPVQMEPLAPRTRLAPLSLGRFALQFTIDQVTHDKLRYAQALLGHALPSGDVAKLFDRALDVLVEQVEKQKFAKCARPRSQKRGSPKGRHIPAAVKRAVWERDGGQCTFVSDAGRRCEAQGAVEFDHIEALARGGESTVGN